MTNTTTPCYTQRTFINTTIETCKYLYENDSVTFRRKSFEKNIRFFRPLSKQRDGGTGNGACNDFCQKVPNSIKKSIDVEKQYINFYNSCKTRSSL